MTLPLEVKQINKRFKDGETYIDVLKTIDFKIKKGEFVAIVGPSGSGKSTLLSIIGALLSTDEGNVLINGKSVKNLDESQRSEVRLNDIGFIFQTAELLPYLHAEDQLDLVAKLNNMDKKERKERAKALLTDVGLEKRRKHYPHQLSGGEKQRVAVARAFMNDPALILADEPTASLDEDRSHEIVSLIKQEVKAKDKAAIMVTHDESLLTYCDRVFRMKDHHLIEDK
ncbi:putative ABC transport system ATP-binding protein [Halolactibacillus halophilus]|uniref:ABC transporter ATP-binding protein n=1 Tax=Halolactibacillus halophilus TaxID=306540 RepID=A0A1I5QZS4_9BACI|nr:ABC transporter ATP-binding protein [Halolactibacillus halophilus]GEM01969.1 ABC transporter ATP-binding protein [Halolactibacillus halophilus]SFP51768.1 putative ABC transport system ATP-binding protein [Halolactibacillus halophilus]